MLNADTFINLLSFESDRCIEISNSNGYFYKEIKGDVIA